MSGQEQEGAFSPFRGMTRFDSSSHGRDAGGAEVTALAIEAGESWSGRTRTGRIVLELKRPRVLDSLAAPQFAAGDEVASGHELVVG